MTASSNSPRCAALASLGILAAGLLIPATVRAGQEALPVYFEDNHAGTFQFLAGTLDLDRPHTLVLVDAHSDASRPRDLQAIRAGVARVSSPEERESRVRGWRRDGTLQAFDWLVPLMPRPVSRVLWVRPMRLAEVERDESRLGRLPPGFERASLESFATGLSGNDPVVVSIDLDSFTGLPASDQRQAFDRVWSKVTSLTHLAAISFAVSRPWLASNEEASRLLLQAFRSALSLAHAEVRFEPYGLEGPDRSERAKSYYLKGREPPRFDPETLSPELKSLLLANAARFEVRLDPARWEDLLARWRAEGSNWRVVLQGQQPDSDGIIRTDPAAAPDLRIEGGPPGRIRKVRWLRWTPKAWAYDVLPELPAGKVFAGAAPPVMEYEQTVIAETDEPVLGAETWMGALPGPERTGVLRVSAELETQDGVAHTARVEIRRGLGAGFRRGLSEQFGVPYVFGAGFLRARGLRGPDTGAGNDCANFLVYAWRHAGLRIPWSNPAQLRRHLALVAEGAAASERRHIPEDAPSRGLVIHLGSHVAALWEDRPPLGTLGPEDKVVHHLGGAPEVLPLGKLLADRGRKTFDLYLGPSRVAAAWIAVGGDLMPGSAGAPPQAVLAGLREADLAVANLETTVASGAKPVEKRYVFEIPAARLLDLRAAGIRAVSLANNHGGDYGAVGLEETLASLDRSGIAHLGAGKDTASAVAAWYGTVKGVTVAFVSVSLTDPDLLPAGSTSAGLATLPRHERELAEAIAAAHEKARVVVVMPHWGMEGTTEVTEEQRRWARWFVEHGADAVVGSGPHVLQAQEQIEGVPVFYSVGNLWFQGRWPDASRRAGLAFLGLDGPGRLIATRLEEFELGDDQ
jgi:capsule synthesis protein PGA_cap